MRSLTLPVRVALSFLVSKEDFQSANMLTLSCHMGAISPVYMKLCKDMNPGDNLINWCNTLKWPVWEALMSQCITSGAVANEYCILWYTVRHLKYFTTQITTVSAVIGHLKTHRKLMCQVKVVHLFYPCVLFGQKNNHSNTTLSFHCFNLIFINEVPNGSR